MAAAFALRPVEPAAPPAPARPAALPMYGIDTGAVAAFWRVLSTALRAEGLSGVGDRLDWPDDLDAHWRHPDLLLSQTCGYPLVEGLDARVSVLGAFSFDVPGAEGTDYRSLVIVREDDPAARLADLRGRVAAYNGRQSHSGYNAFRALVAPLSQGGRFFGRVAETGAHRHSIEAVRAGTADVAAIDCVTFALLARREPAAVAGLRVLDRTAPSPGLPLVTGWRTPAEDLRRLRRALDSASRQSAARDLLITGFVPLDRTAYDPIAATKREAAARGYPELA